VPEEMIDRRRPAKVKRKIRQIDLHVLVLAAIERAAAIK